MWALLQKVKHKISGNNDDCSVFLSKCNTVHTQVLRHVCTSLLVVAGKYGHTCYSTTGYTGATGAGTANSAGT